MTKQFQKGNEIVKQIRKSYLDSRIISERQANKYLMGFFKKVEI